MAAGNTSPKYHAWSRPPEVEGEATGRAIRLAEWTERPLFVVHVTCEESVKRDPRRARPRPADLRRDLHPVPLPDRRRPRPAGLRGREVRLLAAAARGDATRRCSTRRCARARCRASRPTTARSTSKSRRSSGSGDFTKIPNGLPAIEHRLTLLYDRSRARGPHDRGRPRAPRLVGPGADLRARPQGRARARLRRRRRRLRPRGQAHDLGLDPRHERRLRPVRGLGGAGQAALRALAAARPSTRTARSSPSPAAGASSSARSSSRRSR